MKISDKRRQELYGAISDPIMDLRLNYAKSRPLSADELDVKLYRLQIEICWRVREVLRINNGRA